MKVPGVGWSLQYLKHLFLNRNFEEDKNHIKNLFTFYQNSLSELFFVLYPEVPGLSSLIFSLDYIH
jgi:hypothetical protein